MQRLKFSIRCSLHSIFHTAILNQQRRKSGFSRYWIPPSHLYNIFYFFRSPFLLCIIHSSFAFFIPSPHSSLHWLWLCSIECWQIGLRFLYCAVPPCSAVPSALPLIYIMKTSSLLTGREPSSVHVKMSRKEFEGDGLWIGSTNLLTVIKYRFVVYRWK